LCYSGELKRYEFLVYFAPERYATLPTDDLVIFETRLMKNYDAVIIGAGHNGLVCATYLAKSGQKVLVLEAADKPGGLGADREFHPGFRCSVAHTIGHFPKKIAADLNLQSHGFEAKSKSLPLIGLCVNEGNVYLRDGLVSGVGVADTVAFQKYTRLLHRLAVALEPFWLKTIPGIGNNTISELMTFAHLGLNIRRLGKKDMREFLRIASLPIRDLMDEFFDHDALKGMLAWDSLIGSKMAPRSPNGAVITLLYRLAGSSRGAHIIPTGGVDGLIKALCSSAFASGVEVRCSAAVDQILVEQSGDGQAARGVKLANGETVLADRVISAVDPHQTFISLVGVKHLNIGFSNRIRRLRCEGYVGKLHLALDGVPEFSGINELDGRMIIAPELDAIEFAYDDAKYGMLTENPVIEIVVPSMHDASLAPAGKHVLSAHVLYVPYKLKGGWDAEARDRMCERAVDVITRYAPQIREQILHQEFLTPADLEQQYKVTGGHWHHTELAMDQMLMMRPTYEAAQYSTPIPGLFLCGAGCHPGGDLTGAAGHNAAREILR
jgi:phytoene dehydrogenase-like protein